MTWQANLWVWWKFLCTCFVSFGEIILAVSKIILSVINEMVLFVVISLANELSYWDLCPFCLIGPYLVPGTKVLSLQKVFSDRRQPNTWKRKANLTGYLISPQESNDINTFILARGFKPMSLLWLLSEFVLIKFCKGM